MAIRALPLLRRRERDLAAPRGQNPAESLANPLIPLTSIILRAATYPTPGRLPHNACIALTGTRLRTGVSGRAAVSGSVALRWRGLVGIGPPQTRASGTVWPVRPDGPPSLLLSGRGGTGGTSPAHPSGAKASAGRGVCATYYTREARTTRPASHGRDQWPDRKRDVAIRPRAPAVRAHSGGSGLRPGCSSGRSSGPTPTRTPQPPAVPLGSSLASRRAMASVMALSS